MAAVQDFARRGNQRRFGTLLVSAGKIGSYHGVSSARPRAMKPGGAHEARQVHTPLVPQLPRPQVFPIEACGVEGLSCRLHHRGNTAPQPKTIGLPIPRTGDDAVPQPDEERRQETTGPHQPIAGHQKGERHHPGRIAARRMTSGSRRRHWRAGKLLAGDGRLYFKKCDEKLGYVPNVLKALALDDGKAAGVRGLSAGARAERRKSSPSSRSR